MSLSHSTNKRNILFLYIITFLQGMVFYGAIATLYRTDRGLTLVQIGWLDAVFCIVSVACEVPWGLVCDRIGYRKTIIISSGLFFLSKLAFWQAHGIGLFMAERILLGITVAGLSGCDSAYVYRNCEKNESGRVFGYMSALGTMGMLVASCLTSMFMTENFALTGMWTTITYGIAFVLTWFLTDVPYEKGEEVSSLKDMFRLFSQYKPYLLFLLVCALSHEAMHLISVFYNQLLYQRAGIPLMWYGYIYAALNLLALSSASLGKLLDHFEARKIMIGVIMISAVTFFMLTLKLPAVPVVLLVGVLVVAEALYVPLMSEVSNRLVSGGNRATVLSFFAMINDVGMMSMDVSAGYLGDIELNMALIACGIVSVIAIVVVSMTSLKKAS